MRPRPIQTAAKDMTQERSRMAPLRGLGLSYSPAAMPDGYALRLDNFICRENGLETRQTGEQVSSLGSAIVSLSAHEDTLIAATATSIYQAGVLKVSGMTNGNWQSATIANIGGRHTLMCNGANVPRWYNGVTGLWGTSTITGVDATTFRSVIEHGQRAFFLPTNSQTIWYLARGALQGAARPIYVGPLLTKGGPLAAIYSWRVTGGDGPQERLVAVSERGEMVVYSGSGPDNAESWGLAGVFQVPRPVGTRPFHRLGSGLALLTVSGLVEIGSLLKARKVEQEAKAMSQGLGDLLTDAVASGTDWQIIGSRHDELDLVHGNGRQYVLSATNGWSRWVDVGATCWAEVGDRLYYGTAAGLVMRYGVEAVEGPPIRAFMVDGFTAFGTTRPKRFKRARVLYSSPSPYVPRLEILKDFRDVPADFDAANVASAYWDWDDVTWELQPMPWMRATSHQLGPWRGIGGDVSRGAMMMSLQCRSRVTVTGWDVMFD